MSERRRGARSRRGRCLARPCPVAPGYAFPLRRPCLLPGLGFAPGFLTPCRAVPRLGMAAGGHCSLHCGATPGTPGRPTLPYCVARRGLCPAVRFSCKPARRYAEPCRMPSDMSPEPLPNFASSSSSAFLLLVSSLVSPSAASISALFETRTLTMYSSKVPSPTR